MTSDTVISPKGGGITVDGFGQGFLRFSEGF